MSGYNYGVIEVTQGADAANATPRSQVAAMISTAASGYLSSTSTLNAIATSNATTASVPMNGQKFTGMALGTAATDSASVQNIINYVADAHSYAGIELSAFGSAQALTASTYVALNAGTGTTYTGMFTTSDFSINLTTAAITYTGTDTKRFKVTFMGSLETDTINNGILTAIFQNGAQVSNAFFVSLPVIAQVYPIMIQQIIELETGDVVQPYVSAAVNSNATCHGYTVTIDQA